MAFGNISTFYIPTAANAGASQWGTDVRKLLDSADAGSDGTTITNHGTSTGDVLRTVDPYTTSSTDTTQADYGWAVTPADMNSVAGAKRFFPAGDHILTVRYGHNGASGGTGSLFMYVYRVGPAAARTRTLLGSFSGSVALPALAAEVTVNVTVDLPEIVLDVDETIQYSFELSMPGIVIVGRTCTFFTGTHSAVVTRIVTPGLKTLADTTGAASGTGTVNGVSGKVLGTDGSASGGGTVNGVGASRADATGSANGSVAVLGQGSSVAGTVGEATGAGSADGLMSIVLGTVGTVEIGAADQENIKKIIYIFDD